MSNIIVRNVIGTGVFAIPTSDAALYNACAALQSILGGVANFTFQSALVQVVDTPLLPQEMMFLIDVFEDFGSWVSPDIGTLKTRLSSAFSSNPQITSFGNIDVNIYEPYNIYKMVPQIDRIDSHAGIIYFKNEIPPGAQIEVYRYSRAWRGRLHGAGDYYCNGKRWRPDEMLARGQRTYNAGAHQRYYSQGRTHFRFAYRWPAPPGTLAPAIGTRGPLSAYAVSTTVASLERANGPLLIITASPSGYHYNFS